jgi:hypothetical protein
VSYERNWQYQIKGRAMRVPSFSSSAKFYLNDAHLHIHTKTYVCSCRSLCQIILVDAQAQNAHYSNVHTRTHTHTHTHTHKHIHAHTWDVCIILQVLVSDHFGVLLKLRARIPAGQKLGSRSEKRRSAEVIEVLDSD